MSSSGTVPGSPGHTYLESRIEGAPTSRGVPSSDQSVKGQVGADGFSEIDRTVPIQYSAPVPTWRYASASTDPAEDTEYEKHLREAATKIKNSASSTAESNRLASGEFGLLQLYAVIPWFHHPKGQGALTHIPLAGSPDETLTASSSPRAELLKALASEDSTGELHSAAKILYAHYCGEDDYEGSGLDMLPPLEESISATAPRPKDKKGLAAKLSAGARRLLSTVKVPGARPDPPRE